MDPTDVLFASSIIIMLLSLLSTSYKTGYISFSLQSLTRKDQPKFEVDMSKIGKFTGYTLGAFVLNAIYGLIILRDINEIGGILLLSLINTLFIAFGLTYWVLLKPKKEHSHKKIPREG